MAEKIRTIVADDHELFRVGLRQLIQDMNGFEVVAEAEDGESLLKVLDENEADLLVLDHDMPGTSGLDVINRLPRTTQMKVILLTAVETEVLLADYSTLGVDGIVLKSDDPSILRKALVDVGAGGRFFSEPIRERIERAKAVGQLTNRERQVIRHITEGMSNKEIARVMGIALKTVDAHRTNLMTKLDLHNTAEVVAFAVKSDLT